MCLLNQSPEINQFGRLHQWLPLKKQKTNVFLEKPRGQPEPVIQSSLVVVSTQEVSSVSNGSHTYSLHLVNASSYFLCLEPQQHLIGSAETFVDPFTNAVKRFTCFPIYFPMNLCVSLALKSSSMTSN